MVKYELTHDLLAAKIEEKVSDEQKIRRKMRRFLNEQFLQYETRQTLLSKDDLAYIRPYLKSLHLTEAEQRLIRKSESALRRRQRIAIFVTATIILIISALGLQAWFESRRYQAQYLNALSRQEVRSDPTRALEMAHQALSIDKDPAILRDIFHIYYRQTFYRITHTLAGPVAAAAWSPDGRQLLALSHLQTEPELWSEGAAAPIRLDGHEHPVLDVACGPGGWRLTGGNDKTAMLWDSLGQLIRVFRSEDKSQDPDIRAVDLSADGAWILTGAATGRLRLWQRESPDPVMEWELGQEISDLSMRPDGSAFAVGVAAPEFYFFHRVAGEFQMTVAEGQAERVGALRFAADGGLLASGADDGSIRLWQSTGDSLVLTRSWQGHRGAIHSLAFSPDRHWLLSGGADSTARLWELEGEAGALFKGHRGAITAVNFGPRSRTIMTASLDSTVRKWDLPAPFPQLEIDAHTRGAQAMALAQDATRLLSGGGDRRVRLWNLDTREVISEYREHDARVLCVGFLGDSLTGSVDESGRVIVFDPASGQILREFQTHEQGIYGAAFSANGSRLLTAGSDSTARLWDTGSGAALQQLPHRGAVFSVAFNADGDRLLTTCEDSLAYLWDVQGKLLQAFSGHTGAVLVGAFAPLSGDILTGSEDQTVIRWDAGGKIRSVFVNYPEPVRALAADPAEKVLIVGYNGPLATVFDMRGFPISDVSGHRGIIHAIAFWPDGQRFATACDDNGMRVWETWKLPLFDFLSLP